MHSVRNCPLPDALRLREYATLQGVLSSDILSYAEQPDRLEEVVDHYDMES
jgi:hypothetical protein